MIAAVMASTAIGTFIQNAHRQQMVVVNQPPSKGPATDEKMKTLPTMAM